MTLTNRFLNRFSGTKLTGENVLAFMREMDIIFVESAPVSTYAPSPKETDPDPLREPFHGGIWDRPSGGFHGGID